MADKLTSSDINEITTQSDLISKSVRDNFTNLKNKNNELVDEIAAAAIGTTNAETTAARPYHTNLKERLDSIWSGNYPYMKTGGAVTASAPAAMTVEISAGEAKINGIDIKWVASTSGTITAPLTNNRFDVVVAQTDSTLTVVTGAEGANPTLPAVSSTQRALAIITLTPATATITASELKDARNQGCIYWHNGIQRYAWKIQDVIDSSGSGDVYIGKGNYYETLVWASTTRFIFEHQAFLRNPVGGAVIDLTTVDISAHVDASIDHFDGLNSSETYDFNDSIKVDTINEHTSAAGVTIDSVVLKDNDITATSGTITTVDGTKCSYTTGEFDTITDFASTGAPDFTQGVNTNTINELSSPGATGVTIDGVVLKDSEVNTDVINEESGSGNGVTIDSVVLKDNGINTNNINLRHKHVVSGTWDMDTTGAITVSHGLTAANIRGIDVMINSNSAEIYPLDYAADGWWHLNSAGTGVVLARLVAGLFDSSGFSGTSVNPRAELLITYEV